MFWKKKPKIDKIETMKVSSKAPNVRIFKNSSDMHTFAVHLDRSFTDEAKDALEPVIEDFLLAINERLCKKCYWLAYAHDFNEFFLYDEYDSNGIDKHLMRTNESFTYVYIDLFHIIIILNELNKDTFLSLENATLPNGDPLQLSVLYASFRAFYTDDINGIISQIMKDARDTNEAMNVIYDKKSEIDVWYFDSIGAKIHEIAITCPKSKKDTVKDCMISVFFNHDIKLDFITEDIF